MKIIDDKLYRELFFFNSFTLQIIANIFVAVISLFYFRDNNILLILASPFLLILGNVLLLKQSLKTRIFTSALNYCTVTSVKFCSFASIFSFFIIKSFLCVTILAMIQDLHYENLIEFKNETFIKMCICFTLLLSVFIIHFDIYYKKFKTNDCVNLVKSISDTFKLDNKTYFFLFENKITGFTNGKYYFCLNEGLLLEKRTYKRYNMFNFRNLNPKKILNFSLIDELTAKEKYSNAKAVLDYLNIMGIGFNDLDDCHVKNIEMYNV